MNNIKSKNRQKIKNKRGCGTRFSDISPNPPILPTLENMLETTPRLKLTRIQQCDQKYQKAQACDLYQISILQEKNMFLDF